MKVTFNIGDNTDSKSLSIEYDGEYSKEEKNKAIEYIIDSILPTSPLDIYENQLGHAWGDYKWNKERQLHTV